MTHFRPRSFVIVLIVAAELGCIFLVFFSCWVYTTNQLRAARIYGVFASAEDGMRTLAAQGYSDAPEIEILYAGPNWFNGIQPHVWYVVACVRPRRQVDGLLAGNWEYAHDIPGYFFLNMKDGWVNMSEGAFPEFIGFWMRVYDLAGEGSSQPARGWGSSDWTGCDH